MGRDRAAVPRAAAVALFCALSGAASAQPSIFVCSDAKGRTISGDRPPAECVGAIRELRSDGSVRRVIEPPLTPEQKAARAAEEKRQREEAERQRAQMRKDLALLETYASEEEIENARARALATRQALIERATRRMEEHKRERKKLDDEAEFYAKRELPDKLKRAFEGNAALMRSEEKIIAEARAEMQRINERFDAERKRWRELVSAGAIPVQRNPAAQ
jgi:hypothetical protein